MCYASKRKHGQLSTSKDAMKIIFQEFPPMLKMCCWVSIGNSIDLHQLRESVECVYHSTSRFHAQHFILFEFITNYHLLTWLKLLFYLFIMFTAGNVCNYAVALKSSERK